MRPFSSSFHFKPSERCRGGVKGEQPLAKCIEEYAKKETGCRDIYSGKPNCPSDEAYNELVNFAAATAVDNEMGIYGRTGCRPKCHKKVSV